MRPTLQGLARLWDSQAHQEVEQVLGYLQPGVGHVGRELRHQRRCCQTLHLRVEVGQPQLLLRQRTLQDRFHRRFEIHGPDR